MLDFNNVLTITQKELQDARRNRWYLIYVIVFAGLSLALAWLGMTGLGDYGDETLRARFELAVAHLQSI